MAEVESAKKTDFFSEKIFQLFEAEEDVGINVAGKLEVKTKDKTFLSSIFPFLHSDHLAEQLVGKPKTKDLIGIKVFLWMPDNHLI